MWGIWRCWWGRLLLQRGPGKHWWMLPEGTQWRGSSGINVQQPWVDHLSFLQFGSSSGIVGFPGGSEGKESACNAGDLGSVPGLGRSLGEGNGYPLQYSPPGKSHGQRSVAGYSPWGCKESDTTKKLTLSLSLLQWEVTVSPHPHQAPTISP